MVKLKLNAKIILGRFLRFFWELVSYYPAQAMLLALRVSDESKSLRRLKGEEIKARIKHAKNSKAAIQEYAPDRQRVAQIASLEEAVKRNSEKLDMVCKGILAFTACVSCIMILASVDPMIFILFLVAVIAVIFATYFEEVFIGE